MKFKIENIKKDLKFIEESKNQFFPPGWSLKAKKIIKFLIDEQSAWGKKISELEEENKRLRVALEFYADNKIYWPTPISLDI